MFWNNGAQDSASLGARIAWLAKMQKDAEHLLEVIKIEEAASRRFVLASDSNELVAAMGDLVELARRVDACSRSQISIPLRELDQLLP